jgi:hypothetical protein
LSSCGSATVLHGPQISLIGHIISGAPFNLILDNRNTPTSGQIFTSDWNGDGKAGDLVQGTNPGAYMRGVKGHNLNKLINNYNATYAAYADPRRDSSSLTAASSHRRSFRRWVACRN